MKPIFRPLFLAATVAILELSDTQNVCACSVVGYVNAVFATGYSFVANPMLVSPDNTLANVMQGAAAVPNGTAVYLWDVTNQVWSPPSVFQNGWSPNYDVPPGKGFVVYSPAPWTNTFVGETFHGTNVTFVPGANKFALGARPVPVVTSLSYSNVMTSERWDLSFFPMVDGMSTYFFMGNNQFYSDAYTYFENFGWFDPQGAYDTNGPTIGIAQSFFIQNPGPNTNWVNVFTLCPPSAGPYAALSLSSSGLGIRRIGISGGVVSIEVVGGEVQPYEVLFSPDGAHWVTVAADQKGALWTGPFPGGLQGYYRLNPN